MILLNDFKRQYADAGKDLSKVFDEVLASGQYILGEKVARFENRLARSWHKDWAVGCGNGMDAIEMGLTILGLRLGDKVLTTPLSAMATTMAIIKAGGVPVFVDVDQNGNLDLDLAERAMSKDKSIRFMLPVHLYGIPLNLVRLRQLKDKYSLIILEDCAQAIGARFAGELVGSVGEITAVSFYPTKNLGAIGDGGALLGNKSTDYQRAIAYRNYGQSEKYIHNVIGFNSRLDEVQAGMLTFLLDNKLDNFTKRRRQIAKAYLNQIRNRKIELPDLQKESRPVWHLFPVFVKQNREAFMSYCKNQGIQTGIHYPRLIPDQKAMIGQLFEVFGDLVNADFIVSHQVSLPIHPYLTDEEVDRVIQVINSYT